MKCMFKYFDPYSIREFMRDRILEKVLFTDKISAMLVKFGILTQQHYKKGIVEGRHHLNYSIRDFMISELIIGKERHRAKFVNDLMLFINTSY